MPLWKDNNYPSIKANLFIKIIIKTVSLPTTGGFVQYHKKEKQN